MIDLRKTKELDLSKANCLKGKTTFQFKDEISGKNLIAKFIGYYDDANDDYLLGEFKKNFLLSGEPEIGTIYYLASAKIDGEAKNCYVMDFVQGKTIAQILEENKKLHFDFILEIIKQLASGLEKSHNYEISHGDLHEGNIIVDDLGYVKIIDFAFWGDKIEFRKNVNFDIECFNNIIDQLLLKCPDHDLARLEVIRTLCKNITSFKDLKKHIQFVEEVSFDYNLLDITGKSIISAIINEVPFEINLSMVLQETEVDIPHNPTFDQTEEEKRYMEAENSPKGLKLKYSDQRMHRIEEYVNGLFLVKLHQLKQASLIDWKVWVTNSGEKFVGPYKCNYEISLTPKLLKWKRINEVVPFLEKENKLKLTQLLLNE